MQQRSLLFAQFGVIAIVAGLHLFGTINFLYWRLPWFDLITHVLGGLWAGIFAAWILSLFGKPPTLIFCIAAAFLLGVVWEFFESTYGIIHFPKATLDTAKDLTMGSSGGIAAYYLARFITRK